MAANTALAKQMEALMKGSSIDENVAAMAEVGFMPTVEMPDVEKLVSEAMAKGMAEGEAKAKAAALEMCQLSSLAGMPEAAAEMITAGLSREDAGKKLIDMKADRDGKDEINNHSSHSAGFNGRNPLIENAQRMADKAKNA